MATLGPDNGEAPEGLGPADAALVGRLAEIARTLDPPPSNLVEIGQGLFSLYRMDDELAALVADSMAAGAAVRASTADVRLLSFESTGLTVEVQISRTGARISALGQVIHTDAPASGDTVVHLETQSGAEASTAIDADDRFEFADIPAGLVRFRIVGAGQLGIVTAWTQV
jgi:hypothetical protein